jgi:hypothetical protein
MEIENLINDKNLISERNSIDEINLINLKYRKNIASIEFEIFY